MNLNYPLSYEEVKEAYTAFLCEFHFFYPTDNYYVSTLGVYAKVISIFLFGLNTFAVRLPNLLAGIFSLWAAWKVAQVIPGGKKKKAYLVLLLAILIAFLRVSSDNFGLAISVGIYLFIFKAFLENKFKKLFVLLVPLFFASFYNLIFIFLLSLWLAIKRPYFLLWPAAILALVFSTSLGSFIYQTSVLKFIHPSSYIFVLENNLSYGVIHDSPLITDSFNFNRLFYNKPSFLIRRFALWSAKLLDFESLTSFDKASTILAKESIDASPLPWMFFWEIPILLYGLYLLFNNTKQKTKLFCLFVFAGYFFWGIKAFPVLLPMILLAYWQVVNRIKIKKAFAAAFLLLLFFSYSNFLHSFINKPWQTHLASANWEIWKSLANTEISHNQVIVTDRLGENAYFYLFYEQVNKENFYHTRRLGITTTDGRQRIETVGNVSFRSFDFQKEEKHVGQIWIGFPEEFGANIVPDEEIKGGLWLVKSK